LSQKITVDAKVKILELKNTINVMWTIELVRGRSERASAKEVGTEGKACGRGRRTWKGVSGNMKDLTDNVERLAANLTDQVRNTRK